MVRRTSLLAVAICSACSTTPPSRPPRAEFIVATPDSSYWVTSTPAGIRVRGVPMTLARYGGAFHEVYVADVDRSYTDAVFAGERVYTRDLLTDDSMLVYDDTLVTHLAAVHARTHPAALPLTPNDDDPEDPEVVVRGETDVIDLRGPLALLEHRSEFDHQGGERADTTRVAVDLRTGRAAHPGDVARDSAADDGATLVTTPSAWRRTGYELIARSDSTGATVSLSLRDDTHHSWPVLTLLRDGRLRLYWIDAPPLDSRTRLALSRAFNAATTYGEDVTYVRRVTPPRDARHTTVSALHLASAVRD